MKVLVIAILLIQVIRMIIGVPLKLLKTGFIVAAILFAISYGPQLLAGIQEFTI